ncbi:MAG: cytochrome c biogenesis protein ResB, partial [Candidatus Eiseniibacteriota bacterium]
IDHPGLPFTVRIDHFYANSELFRASDLPFDSVPRANRGTAVTHDLVAVERPVSSGVEQNGMDLPAALVTLERDGQELGTWLVSLYFDLSSDLSDPLDAPQGTTVDGRTFDLVMRHKRIYKPYSIHLIDFRHDRYLGTDTPRNFSSQIRLIDPTRNEDREVLIYMNNPLRYEGETFYQASFKRGDTATILQVVRNPGWLLPYIACTIGGLGMVIHFGMNLVRFLRRNRA